MNPTRDFANIILQKYRDKHKEMLAFYKHKKPCTINDPEEVIALGLLSGGEMVYDFDASNYKINISTLGVASAFWDGKQFHYYQNTNIKEKIV
jgi:hypothetical protein